tara:strand:+ start:199 stop:657 length:459 start_codon:yes stop_codon:yes gene_type:complete
LGLNATFPTAFGTFANWLYTQQVVDAAGDTPCPTYLLVLRILAHQLLVPALQNQIMEILQERQKDEDRRLPSAAFRYVYGNTGKDSPLRRYIVDACSNGPLGDIINTDNYPPRLLVEIINAMRERVVEREWEPSKEQAASYLVSEAVGKRKV